MQLARLYKLQVRELAEFALFVTAPDLRITTWNRGIEATFGYTEEEWIGQHASIIFSDEDRSAGVVEAEREMAMEHGRSVDVRWHKRKDGSQVYMTGVLRALRDDDGTLVGFSKVFQDDTGRKLLEDALTKSNQDLQQFAFLASHDLQEPLRTLNSFAQLLGDRYRGRLDSEADQYLAFIEDAAQRMSTLVSDLLEFSQISQEEGRPGSVYLDDDLETALHLLGASIVQEQAIVTHDPLPQVELERSQMVRLFQNLIGNALKFRKKGETPRIHVSSERTADEWIIRVADNGIGFAPENAEAIFAPFRRLHSRREYPGSGIGLSACKRIVEKYGGRIGADSRPGEGSTFWFTLPASVESA